MRSSERESWYDGDMGFSVPADREWYEEGPLELPRPKVEPEVEPQKEPVPA